MPSSASEKLNGSMPISRRRTMDSGGIRVQRGKDQVARERRFDAGADRLLVAHLPDHDDIRVGPQERLHRYCERQSRFRIHLHLTQSPLRDLYRVFRGPDLRIRRIQITQHRVQRRRLARPCRPAREKKPVRLFDRALAQLQIALRQSELVERDRFAGGENTHYDVFDAALRRDGRDAQLDIERAETLELDLAVLGLAPLRNIEVAHDLQARGDRAAISMRHGNIVLQRTVFAEADLGLALPGVRLDMDVGCALLVGVDDDFVDELDDLVVGGRGRHILGFVAPFVLHVRQEFPDRFSAHFTGRRAEHLVQRILEFPVAADPVDDLAFRVNVVDDPRAANFFRIGCQHDDAVFAVVDGHPHAAFDEFASHVLEEIDRLDALRLERLVGHVEIRRERLADGAHLYLELVEQHRFDVEVLSPRRTRRQLELFGRYHRVGHQVIVLSLDQRSRLLTLTESNGQRLAQVSRAVFHHWRKRLSRLRVDNLHHADQLFCLRIHDRRHQHLFRAIARLAVYLLEEIELRTVRLELFFVVYVADVDHLLVHRNKAGDALLGDRQLQVLERVQPRLDAGDD